MTLDKIKDMLIGQIDAVKRDEHLTTEEAAVPVLTSVLAEVLESHALLVERVEQLEHAR